MEEELGRALARERLLATLASGIGLLALLLACVGLYSVTSYDVARRTKEIGVRMALGARTGDVLKMTLTRGLRLALTGVFIGLGAGLALTRYVETLLFGVRPFDPLTFAGIALVLLSVALLACWLPARRATKINPMVALRVE
jgi:ABC-type antimicrobial peptide transport system permease subunit